MLVAASLALGLGEAGVCAKDATPGAVVPDRAPPPEGATPCGANPVGMACVPGGAFLRGSDAGPANERPRATVTLDPYWMDVFEVTFGEYQRCVQQRGCKPALPYYGDFSRDRQPMVGMTWFDARDYCRFAGKHLPTEAEWEKAARGPDGATHPWGDEPATCERAVILDARGRSCGVRNQSVPRLAAVGRTFEVGSRPAFAYGLHDMVGNAWEWVADWYAPSFAACGAACEGSNPRGPCDGAERCPGHREKLVKGGSWYWDASYATSSYRRSHPPQNQPLSHFGFRCAASLEEGARLVARQATHAEPTGGR